MFFSLLIQVESFTNFLVESQIVFKAKRFQARKIIAKNSLTQLNAALPDFEPIHEVMWFTTLTEIPPTQKAKDAEKLCVQSVVATATTLKQVFFSRCAPFNL